ncbi:phage portal protein [Phaeobacter gallaeciensis]|uniref:Phage portal protein, HK97 family n=1 Tax=Phaeobacter gallaeciensis TaxID=60890 RepID=A0AAD0ECU5_9RHOB|nr:phage portal protein [Phaeobacter gallaeciensis]AHD09528.1 phage portal protein, HK97 family [Phaeobacter gallaeciensis DSM 26640]ATE92793.1 phage portal protein, HK97 family [Phaeobacter gallaeciensis]ATE97385.1 phage portal protein, HK97 family [Phaeobacter gallaeciensis]ATF01458.1 phage portal protein, HK97 family [Phaeobacter gallaeciensis]ATF05838.1 phage portal protein, HK97 family [Phaeobacter gallaeciensis]
MGIFDRFRLKGRDQERGLDTKAMTGDGMSFSGLNDPALYEFIRGGTTSATASGVSVSAKTALKNTAVLRSVSLLSFSIGMLPLHLKDKVTKENAVHPVHQLLHRRPNAWQTAYEFRAVMQQRALTEGDAFALKVRSGRRIIQLVPLVNCKPTQNSDWSLSYTVTRKDGGKVTYSQDDILHLRYGLSDDGFTGLSLVKQAAEAIGLALSAERAAARMFSKGMIVDGVLRHPNQISPEVFERLKASMQEAEGAENAHKWKILEEGMDMTPFQAPGRDAQGLEQRQHQIEEIARVFGVPRPLLMMDETSWGSGIDVLGQFFVRYSLNPWFEAWQQAIERDLLTEAEADRYEAKFNAGGLLRGSMKDQADFFAKGLGSGGHQPWLHPDEPRAWMDLPQRHDLPEPMGAKKGASNEHSQTS